MGKGDVGPEDVWRQQHLSLALKELRASAPAEREGDGWENYYCQTERGGGRGRESCLCVSACAVSVSVLTPAARPPSPLILWRALRSSGPFFFSLYLFPLFPLSISCPFLSALPPCNIFSFLPFLFLLLWCRIFIARADEVHCWQRWAGWMDGLMGGWVDPAADQSSAAKYSERFPWLNVRGVVVLGLCVQHVCF